MSKHDEELGRAWAMADRLLTKLDSEGAAHVLPHLLGLIGSITKRAAAPNPELLTEAQARIKELEELAAAASSERNLLAGQAPPVDRSWRVPAVGARVRIKRIRPDTSNWVEEGKTYEVGGASSYTKPEENYPRNCVPAVILITDVVNSAAMSIVPLEDVEPA